MDFCYESRVTAAIFLRNAGNAAQFLRKAGNHRYFSTKYQRFRVFFHRSAVIVEKIQPNFRSGILLVISYIVSEIRCIFSVLLVIALEFKNGVLFFWVSNIISG